MNKRSIILYWLLLLVPTIVIGVGVFQLLRHEQERIDQQALSSSGDRARAIADTLQITVDAVEDGFTEALRGIPVDRLAETLSMWQESNPLVRNVFIWRPGVGLQFPLPGPGSTREERHFIARYDGLFSGRVPWQPAGLETTAPPSNALVSDKEPGSRKIHKEGEQSALVQEIRKLKTGRQRLVSLAKGKVEVYRSTENAHKEAAGFVGGWIPWFSENRLNILGWVQPELSGSIYGVELELMTLLSRLVTDFPATAPKGMVYALIDGGGQILHQAGKRPVEPGATPDLAVPLAPCLPHWQVAVYSVDGHLTAQTGKGFIILAGLLFVIFLAAIILGGFLLTWQAHHNMTDARQKTTFVSNVSHELKTPLTSIRMYAELLSDGRIKDQAKKGHYLQVIVAESQRLTRLVNNVLDFSRLEQGRKKYHLEDLELTGYLREIVEANRLRIQEAGLVVKDLIPHEEIIVRADRDAVGQVMLNLMDNAIKYAADGKELVIALKVLDGCCELRVMDRGPGVPLSHRAGIFEKFHRVDDSLTSRQPGSGLGLSIARRLLRDLDGDLVYEPREGGGSCFVAVVPC